MALLRIAEFIVVLILLVVFLGVVREFYRNYKKNQK